MGHNCLLYPLDTPSDGLSSTIDWTLNIFFIYVGIGFQFLIIPAIIFFIPVCLCNLFLNTNLWGTIVYYILFILLLMASFFNFWTTTRLVAFSIFSGPALGYGIWKYCLKYYTNATDNKRTEIGRSIVNVFTIVLVMISVGLIGPFITEISLMMIKVLTR